jgi:hypothetical protein
MDYMLPGGAPLLKRKVHSDTVEKSRLVCLQVGDGV